MYFNWIFLKMMPKLPNRIAYLKTSDRNISESLTVYLWIFSLVIFMISAMSDSSTRAFVGSTSKAFFSFDSFRLCRPAPGDEEDDRLRRLFDGLSVAADAAAAADASGTKVDGSMPGGASNVVGSVLFVLSTSTPGGAAG